MPIPNRQISAAPAKGETLLAVTVAAVPAATPLPATATAGAAPGLWLLLAALVPFSLGYFFSYLYRAVNAVVAPDLIRDLKLSAGELGLLTSAYLLAFALFQVPLGILLDRYGPRRVQATLVATGALGALLFAFGNTTIVLTIARAIIGVGFAGGLMSGFKAVVIWVPEPRRALANALVMSVGAIGLLVSTAPMEAVVQAYGWRQAFVGLSAVTILVAALILFVVPEKSATPQPGAARPGLGSEIKEVAGIFRNRVFLALVPLLALTAGVHIAIQTLWAGPWFRDVAGLDRGAIAQQLFWMAAAFFAGILVSGAIADWFVRRGASLLDVMMGFLAFFFAAQIGLAFELRSVVPGFDPRTFDLVVWCVFGMTGQVAVLAYPWLSSCFGARLSGRANSAINFMMFLTAFAAQYGVGAIIDQFPRTSSGGYPQEAYRTAFFILLALQAAALVWFQANRGLMRAAEAGFGKTP
jgi:MFS family permease